MRAARPGAAKRLVIVLGLASVVLGAVTVSVVLGSGQLSDKEAQSGKPPASSSATAVSSITQQVTAERDAPFASWGIPTPDGLSMIPVAAPGGRVWVGELGGHQLTLLLAASGRYTRFAFPSAAEARTNGITVDSSGLVWLAQDGRHSIASFDVETRKFREWQTPTPRSSPFGIVADRDDHIWFTETAGNRIGLFDPHQESFQEYPIPVEHSYPYLLAIGADERVWFTTLMQPSIGVLDPRTGDVQLISVPGVDPSSGTTGIALSPDGTVWFGIRGGGLGRVDPTTLAISVYRSPGGDSYGVAVDVRGRVWLASTESTVYAFEPVLERFCPVATGDGARWLTVAPDGAVWVAQGRDVTNAVGRISPERASSPCQSPE